MYTDSISSHGSWRNLNKLKLEYGIKQQES